MSADAPSKPLPAAAASQGWDTAANQARDDEGQLEKPRNTSQEPGFFSRRRMLGPVEKDYGDYGLLACSLVTGMVDGASFLNWGVFVGMQTGKLNWGYVIGQLVAATDIRNICILATTTLTDAFALRL